MGVNNKPFNVGMNPRKEAHQVKLDRMLDFGADTHPTAIGEASSQATMERLNQLLKKLQELNQRVDALQQRY